EDEYAHRRWAHALRALARWPEKQVDEAGNDLSLLVGYLLYKVDLPDDALDRLKPLAAEPNYVRRRPALLYYLARSYYGDSLYAPGAPEMTRSPAPVDAQARPTPPPPADDEAKAK